MLEIVTAAFELRVHHLLADTAPLVRSSVTPVYTRGGYTVRLGPLQKKQILQRLCRTGGQHNAIASGLASHKGYAAIVANVRAAHYRANARETMSFSICMSWSWDGATYGGLSVNVAMCVDPLRLVACHCKPAVAHGAQGPIPPDPSRGAVARLSSASF